MTFQESYNSLIDDLSRRLSIIAVNNPKPEILADLDGLVMDFAKGIRDDNIPEDSLLLEKYAKEILDSEDEYQNSRKLRRRTLEYGVDSINHPYLYILNNLLSDEPSPALKDLLRSENIKLICGVAVCGTLYGAAFSLKAKASGQDVPYATLIPSGKDRKGYPLGFLSTIDPRGSKVLVVDDVLNRDSATRKCIDKYLSARSSSGIYVAGQFKLSGADYCFGEITVSPKNN